MFKYVHYLFKTHKNGLKQFSENVNNLKTCACSCHLFQPSVSKKNQTFKNKNQLVLNQVRNLSCERFVEILPTKVQPYMRLMRVDKPIGSLLLYMPCAYSIILATPPGMLPNFYYLG